MRLNFGRASVGTRCISPCLRDRDGTG